LPFGLSASEQQSKAVQQAQTGPSMGSLMQPQQQQQQQQPQEQPQPQEQQQQQQESQQDFFSSGGPTPLTTQIVPTPQQQQAPEFNPFVSAYPPQQQQQQQQQQKPVSFLNL